MTVLDITVCIFLTFVGIALIGAALIGALWFLDKHEDAPHPQRCGYYLIRDGKVCARTTPHCFSVTDLPIPVRPSYCKPRNDKTRVIPEWVDTDGNHIIDLDSRDARFDDIPDHLTEPHQPSRGGHIR